MMKAASTVEVRGRWTRVFSSRPLARLVVLRRRLKVAKSCLAVVTRKKECWDRVGTLYCAPHSTGTVWRWKCGFYYYYYYSSNCFRGLQKIRWLLEGVLL